MIGSTYKANQFMNQCFVQIMAYSIETLVRTQGIGDLYRIYLGAQRDDLDYHLAYIPSDSPEG